MYGLNQFEVNQDLFGGFCLENKQTKKKKRCIWLGINLKFFPTTFFFKFSPGDEFFIHCYQGELG